ncbi:uncharacterized protein EV154DRAFT_492850 [Mucor mucedo]|uniref:uncharacterized protein n=1 Tax=Mucor mucedo TaxID=29922 RepID=UPI0022205F3F|nr:uncharacterized protein EV154DRAFT_492850 [Mucor mucedo]KAI7896270.1 hypothetical protein EV154DRAFT_492850 [Mucor mucedo]
MSSSYNFFKHSCCVELSFDEDAAYISYYKTGIRANQTMASTTIEKRASILYNAFNGDILAYGESADIRKKEEDREHIFYVDNILVKLNEIYIKTKQHDYINDAHVTLLQKAMVTLLQHARDDFTFKQIPNDGFHYVISLPTFWDFEIRDKVIRPLYIQAGLINEEDDHDRLLFFTELESNFRYVQCNSLFNGKTRVRLKYNKKYILFVTKFTPNKCFVTLDLVSAHYPHLDSGLFIDVAKSLKSVRFTVPFGTKLEKYIQLRLKDKGTNMNPIKDALLKDLIRQYKSCQPFSYKTQENRPFKNIYTEELCETKNTYLQSMRIEEINRDLLCSVSKDCQNHIQKLLEFQNDKIEAFVYICRNMNVLENEFEVLDDELKSLMRTYVDQNYKHNFLSFDKDKIRKNYKEFGNNFHLLSQCELVAEDLVRQSCVQRSPKTLPRNSDAQEQRKMVSRSLFENSNPDYIASIDISLESVKYVCGFLGDNDRVTELTEYDSLDIQPLESYFKQQAIYRKLVLHISKRMKKFMEENFDDYLSSYPGDREYPIQSLYLDISSTKIKESLQKSELKKLENVATTKSTLIPVFQAKYTHIFLLMYLAYVNTLISAQLDKCFEKDWRDKNIGYTLMIEDFFMENVDIFKEDIQQLFHLSSIPQKVVERRKVRLCNIGSCLLPAFQKRIGQEFKFKSYFVIAQLHSTYIHLGLNQVVKHDLSEKEMFKAMFISDRIIPIENLNISLCKTIWKSITTNKTIDYCDTHKDQDPKWDFFKLDNYKSVLHTLKLQMADILSSGSKSLNMDNEIELNLSEECNCRTHTTLRNIMIGFKPVIENVTSMIISATFGMRLFYELDKLDYLFIFENAFIIEHESILYKAYTKTLQEEMRKTIQLKEISTQGILMQKPINQLLQPVAHKEHPMYSAFKNGDPYKVAGSTYGLILKKLIVTGIENSYLICIKHNDDGTDAYIDVGDTIIVVRKEQIILHSGINVKFKIRFKNIQRDDTLLLPCLLELELIKFHPEIRSSEGNFLSAKNPHESISEISLPIDGVKSDTCVNLNITYGYYAIEFFIRDEISVQHPDTPYHITNLAIAVVETKNIVYL